MGDPVILAQKLFAGGVRLLQLRNKKASSRELLQQLERILALAPADARVIVNDRVDVALLAGQPVCTWVRRIFLRSRRVKYWAQIVSLAFPHTIWSKLSKQTSCRWTTWASVRFSQPARKRIRILSSG